MKKLAVITFVSIFFGLHQSYAQKQYRHTISGSAKDSKVLIHHLGSDLKIEGNDGKDIVIIAHDYEGIPERAQGLKPLSALGEDNTEVGLNITTSGNQVEISGVSRKASDGDYTIQIPRSMSLHISYDTHWGGDIDIENLAGEIEVNAMNSDVTMEQITGPVVLNSVSGDIEIVFSALSQANPSSITATSGDVDITLPGNTKANFELKTISGDVYTDLDLDFQDKEGMQSIMNGMQAMVSNAGGGVDFSIQAISGDIYLRQAK